MSPEYLAVLKAEIAKPAYSGMTAAQIATALNTASTTTVTPNGKIPVETETARGVLFASVGHFWPAIKSAAQNPADLNHLVASVMFDAITLQTTLATNNPQMYAVINGVLGALVAANAGLLDQATKDALMALAIAPSVTVDVPPVALTLSIGIPGAPNAVVEANVTEAQA
jgi:hypothetical protein